MAVFVFIPPPHSPLFSHSNQVNVRRILPFYPISKLNLDLVLVNIHYKLVLTSLNIALIFSYIITLYSSPMYSLYHEITSPPLS